jgi:hypothetical protein
VYQQQLRLAAHQPHFNCQVVIQAPICNWHYVATGIMLQTVLQTVMQQVEELARSVLRDPLHIVIGERNTTQHLVKQRLLFVGREAGKLLALRQMLKGGGVKPPVLVSE